MTIDFDVNEGLCEAYGMKAGAIAASIEDYAIQMASLATFETEVRLGKWEDNDETRDTTAWLRRQARGAQARMIEEMCAGTHAKVAYERRYWVQAS